MICGKCGALILGGVRPEGLGVASAVCVSGHRTYLFRRGDGWETQEERRARFVPEPEGEGKCVPHRSGWIRPLKKKICVDCAGDFETRGGNKTRCDDCQGKRDRICQQKYQKARYRRRQVYEL